MIARPQATPDPFAHRPPQPKVEIEYKPREDRDSKPKPSPPKKTIPDEKAGVSGDDKSVLEAPPASGVTSALEKETHGSLQEDKEDKSKERPPARSEDPAPPVESDEAKSDKTVGPIDETEPEKVIPELSRFVKDHSTEVQSRSGKKKPEQRRAICFECGDSHLANAQANSTQCRKCGRLISMKDIHIREPWSSRVQTRGDVFIHKKGIVQGAAIQCHNLIVEGDFTGSAECSGDLVLRRHGKIIGKVVCDRLLVEKRAKVEFLNTVQTNECKIDGLVSGNLACRGRLALEKKATLTGNIKVGTLTVADGAKHTGQIQMGGF